ncbi:MAG: hypothetical protein AAF456_12290 [Planctomycetota bacterium]
MSDQKHHVIILPYYCQDEIDRYLKIARHLGGMARPKCSFSFLLAASPLADLSSELFHAFSAIAPTHQFKCPTQIFGYPEGPTAMYWDAMDYIADNFAEYRGFSLWLESDMCPVQEDWLDRLSDEWFDGNEPVLMGCFVPEVFKHRIFRKPKKILDPHINGGACYSLDFAHCVPHELRDAGVFDMVVYQAATRIGEVRATDLISFATMDSVRRDIVANQKVLLHGFMQPKNQFIDECVRPLSAREKSTAGLVPVQAKMASIKRRVRTMFVRRGHKAMLENMLLAKERLDSTRRAA